MEMQPTLRDPDCLLRLCRITLKLEEIPQHYNNLKSRKLWKRRVPENPCDPSYPLFIIHYPLSIIHYLFFVVILSGNPGKLPGGSFRDSLPGILSRTVRGTFPGTCPGHTCWALVAPAKPPKFGKV